MDAGTNQGYTFSERPLFPEGALDSGAMWFGRSDVLTTNRQLAGRMR